MHDDKDWGPWIPHCGTTMPKFDAEMQVEIPTGGRFVIDAGGETAHLVMPAGPYLGPTYASSWIWAEPGPYIPVARYRYRRPRALHDLIALAEDPPALAEELCHADAA